MKSNIMLIIQKELYRFFTDKRMLVTTLLLPGLMIYVLYTFMGSAMTGMYGTEENYEYSVSVVNLPSSIKQVSENSGMKLAFTDIEDAAVSQAKEDISENKLDLLMLFPADFDEHIAAGTGNGSAPNIEIYYNAASTASSEVYGGMISVLDTYESELTNLFDINKDIENTDLAKNEDMMGKILSSMMPLLLIIFLFSGCMAIAPESIAGEKERGTIATLLVTPMKRRELAIGKTISLGILALCSGISSFIGTFASLPNLMGMSGSEGMDMNIFSPADYVWLVFIIFSTVLLLVALISIISAFAKSVKEASTMVMPLMIIVMLIGVSGMFGNGAQESLVYYFIPVYNSVQAMSGIFSLHYNALNLAVTIASNLVYAGIGTFVLTRMFNSENIMFSKA